MSRDNVFFVKFGFLLKNSGISHQCDLVCATHKNTTDGKYGALLARKAKIVSNNAQNKILHDLDIVLHHIVL